MCDGSDGPVDVGLFNFITRRIVLAAGASGVRHRGLYNAMLLDMMECACFASGDCESWPLGRTKEVGREILCRVAKANG